MRWAWFHNDADALKMQVEEQRRESEKAQALAEDLKRRIAEHVSVEEHRAAHDQMQIHNMSNQPSRAIPHLVYTKQKCWTL